MRCSYGEKNDILSVFQQYVSYTYSKTIIDILTFSGGFLLFECFLIYKLNLPKSFAIAHCPVHTRIEHSEYFRLIPQKVRKRKTKCCWLQPLVHTVGEMGGATSQREQGQVKDKIPSEVWRRPINEISDTITQSYSTETQSEAYRNQL